MPRSSGRVQCLVALAKAKRSLCPRNTGTPVQGSVPPSCYRVKGQGKGKQPGSKSELELRPNVKKFEQSQNLFPGRNLVPEHWHPYAKQLARSSSPNHCPVLQLALHTAAFWKEEPDFGLYCKTRTAKLCCMQHESCPCPPTSAGFTSVSHKETNTNSESPSGAAQTAPGAAVEEVLGAEN